METGYHCRLFHLGHEGIQGQWSHYTDSSQAISHCCKRLSISFSADINYNKIHKFINFIQHKKKSPLEVSATNDDVKWGGGGGGAVKSPPV